MKVTEFLAVMCDDVEHLEQTLSKLRAADFDAKLKILCEAAKSVADAWRVCCVDNKDLLEEEIDVEGEAREEDEEGHHPCGLSKKVEQLRRWWLRLDKRNIELEEEVKKLVAANNALRTENAEFRVSIVDLQNGQALLQSDVLQMKDERRKVQLREYAYCLERMAIEATIPKEIRESRRGNLLVSTLHAVQTHTNRNIKRYYDACMRKYEEAIANASAPPAVRVEDLFMCIEELKQHGGGLVHEEPPLQAGPELEAMKIVARFYRITPDEITALARAALILKAAALK